jgi:uncharacterized DUF497 family protein
MKSFHYTFLGNDHLNLKNEKPMGLKFEWNNKKFQENFKKHRISFEEACTVFGDPLSLTIADPLHSLGEKRLIIIGQSNWQRLLVVVHTEKGDTLRVISARLATKQERKIYEET